MTCGVLPWVETTSWVSGSSRRGRPECPDVSELSSRGTGCSTSASTRFAMRRAVRMTEPLPLPERRGGTPTG